MNSPSCWRNSPKFCFQSVFFCFQSVFSPLGPGATPSRPAPLWVSFTSVQGTDCCPCALPGLGQKAQLLADLFDQGWAHRLVAERISLPTSIGQVISKANLSEMVRIIIRSFVSCPKCTHLDWTKSLYSSCNQQRKPAPEAVLSQPVQMPKTSDMTFFQDCLSVS